MTEYACFVGDVGVPEAETFPVTEKIEMGLFVGNHGIVKPGIKLDDRVYLADPFTMLRHSRELMDLCLQQIDLLIESTGADEYLDQGFFAQMTDGSRRVIVKRRDLLDLYKQAAIGLVESPRISVKNGELLTPR